MIQVYLTLPDVCKMYAKDINDCKNILLEPNDWNNRISILSFALKVIYRYLMFVRFINESKLEDIAR